MAPCNDKASQSNPEEAAATHASLVMDVDFDGQVIQGSVEYTVEIMVSVAYIPLANLNRVVTMSYTCLAYHTMKNLKQLEWLAYTQ